MDKPYTTDVVCHSRDSRPSGDKPVVNVEVEGPVLPVSHSCVSNNGLPLHTCPPIPLVSNNGRSWTPQFLLKNFFYYLLNSTGPTQTLPPSYRRPPYHVSMSLFPKSFGSWFLSNTQGPICTFSREGVDENF